MQRNELERKVKEQCKKIQRDLEVRDSDLEIRKERDMQDIFLQRELVQKVKVKDEDRVELEEVSDHANENFEFKQQLNENERKNL